MSEIVFVVSPKQNAFFKEMAELFCAEINAAGGTASISLEGFPDEPEPGQAFVLLPPHEYRAVNVDPITGRDNGAWPGDEMLARTIFITAEQPGGEHFRLNVGVAAEAGALFDINMLAVRAYRRIGLPVEHLPLGYSTHWDRYDEQRERDIDVFFLGTATPRRLEALSSYSEELSRVRTRLTIYDGTRPNVPGSPSFVAGDEKFDLLARSKVVLNLHRDVDLYFEWQRVLETAHTGAALVSERSTFVEPMKPGVDFLEGEVPELGHLAVELALDEARRRQVARGAYETIRDRMPLRRSAERLMETAERLPAARQPRFLRSKAWVVANRFQRAASWRARMTTDRVYRTAAPDRGDGGRWVLNGAIKELQLDLMDLQRRARAMEADIPPDAEAEDVSRSPSYDRPAPQVTVICALYNHAGHIAGALDSVKDQRFGDWELVVCDDGSTDGSGKVVEDWIEANPERAALLVRHPVNRGLPAARNTAVERARGEYVLVLDADNELYPNCLERLTEALDNDPKAAFAYGILEQFDRNGPVGLSGYFGWEPERLVEENYIDALALIRRETLQQLGGYIEDRRIYGWEDYDLWCRVAEAGERAAHVAEIVARYRLSAGSMITLTNLSVGDAREAIAERSPALFSGDPDEGMSAARR